MTWVAFACRVLQNCWEFAQTILGRSIRSRPKRIIKSRRDLSFDNFNMIHPCRCRLSPLGFLCKCLCRHLAHVVVVTMVQSQCLGPLVSHHRRRAHGVEPKFSLKALRERGRCQRPPHFSMLAVSAPKSLKRHEIAYARTSSSWAVMLVYSSSTGENRRPSGSRT